jgi:DNA-binding response OmpR family regulator
MKRKQKRMTLRGTLESSPSPVYSPREASPYRESNPRQLVHDVYDDGYLRVEHQNYYVACDGQSIKLPRTEFLIFSRLARSPERIVAAADLWESAWGKEKPLNPESLHVYIHRLRNKFATHRVQIETMVNVGYRLLPAQPR